MNNDLVGKEIDPFLEKLAQIAEIGVEYGVTIYVSGLIVTGTIINAAKYFELTSEKLKANGDKVITQYTDAISAVVNKAYESNPNYRKDSIGFINLKNAKILNGDKLIPGEGGLLWRAKISSVDAFNLGILESS
ncbi:gas vesicle accessory protein GvpU [uncultured Psychrosphaera sp.]|uniref:gas vesicle accessory protein GvpU n=1 Tax=uncultured Psychrosphaera sp. TaxID=1403522 RepID=UPI002614C383|nr:gas vesicle accessory protein GvpU [uncultured Psychrosphaera sp.]